MQPETMAILFRRKAESEELPQRFRTHADAAVLDCESQSVHDGRAYPHFDRAPIGFLAAQRMMRIAQQIGHDLQQLMPVKRDARLAVVVAADPHRAIDREIQGYGAIHQLDDINLFTESATAREGLLCCDDLGDVLYVRSNGRGLGSQSLVLSRQVLSQLLQVRGQLLAALVVMQKVAELSGVLAQQLR